MCRASGSSWWRGTSLYWNNLPIQLILLFVRFFLFFKLKEIIKGTHFEGMEAIKKAIMTELKGIPEESFQQHIEVWEKALDSREITLKEKSCSLLFGIEINCLWHQPCYFSDVSCIIVQVKRVVRATWSQTFLDFIFQIQVSLGNEKSFGKWIKTNWITNLNDSNSSSLFDIQIYKTPRLNTVVFFPTKMHFCKVLI